MLTVSRYGLSCGIFAILTSLWLLPVLPTVRVQAQDPGFQVDEEIEFDIGEFEGFGDDDFETQDLTPEQAAAVGMLSVGMIIAALVIGLIMFGLMIFAAYLLMDALNSVPEEYRQLSPMVPWLLFVPVVNLVILFLVFLKVPESLQAYLNSVGDTSQGDCGKNMGLWGAILYVVGCTAPIGLIMLVIAITKINAGKRAVRAASAA